MGTRSIATGFRGRLTSWLAAYALVLHAVLAGAAIGAVGMAADAAPAFEICGHNGGAADAPGVPDGRAQADTHCKLCVAAGHGFVPARPALLRSVVIVGLVQVAVHERDRPALPELFSEQPRGPPFTA